MVLESADKVIAEVVGPIQDIPAEDIKPSMIVSPVERATDTSNINTFLAPFNASVGNPSSITDVTGTELTISEALFVDRSTGEYKIGRGRARYLHLFQDTINDPQEIWELTRSTGGIKRHFIKAYVTDKGERRYVLIVWDKTKTGWEGTTAFYTKDDPYVEKQRAGTRVYKKRGKVSGSR